MLAGVGPVLGEGLAGHFVHPDGVSTDFEYVAGAAELAGSLIANLRAGCTGCRICLDSLLSA